MNKADISPPSISQLMQNCYHISDIRFGNSADDIIFLTSVDGVGILQLIENRSNLTRCISKSHNVRGTVGYGGGSFDHRENAIAFCDKDGAIWFFELSAQKPFTQVVPGIARTSSCRISPDKKSIIYVFKKGESNGISIAATDGLKEPVKIAANADFYMQPVWHPRGDTIAWAEWDHPHMPWDASRIKIVHFDKTRSKLSNAIFIDGKNNHSANQPQFSPDGHFLSYIQRNGEWDDLMLYNLDTKAKSTLVHGDQFHLRMPDWIQGLHSYRWAPDSQTIYFIKYHFGTASLEGVHIHSRERFQISTTPYIWMSQLEISTDGKLGAFIGQTASSCDEIVRFDLANRKVILPATGKENAQESLPDLIQFKNREGKTGHAFFYPALTEKIDNEPAPCIIKIHSGPTSLKHAGYSPETEFFRLHGYSVAYPNYRGSVSFGYSYQYALERKWGEAEVEDTLDLINTLEKRGVVRRDRIAVMGSSAGGFSVLQLLINHPGLFKAAICSYAVSDLIDDAKNTHKFEKYYHRFLTGRYPEEEARFIARSPITHLDKIKDPVAIFHGEDDPVVSVNQSRKIYQALNKNSIPCTLMVFEGEGHGFRRNENIESCYQAMISFFQSYL